MLSYTLTTSDNKYDPFNQFDEWSAYDHRMGYFTMEYLMRIVRLGDGLTEAETETAFSNAIDDIIRLTPSPNGDENVRYVKIERDL